MMIKPDFAIRTLRFTAIILAGFLVSPSCTKESPNTENHLPKAKFTLTPDRGAITTVFNFNADSVSDFEDPSSLLEVRWDWNHDKIFDTEFTTEKSATHAYNAVGVYFPLMEVRDTKGMTDTVKNLVVVVSDTNNRPPDEPIYITPPEWQTWMDQTIIFKWTCNDFDNDPVQFDIWIGTSREFLSIWQGGITDFNLVDGVKQFEITLAGFKFNCDYYWQIGARDPAGNYTMGKIWKFTTRPANS